MPVIINIFRVEAFSLINDNFANDLIKINPAASEAKTIMPFNANRPRNALASFFTYFFSMNSSISGKSGSSLNWML